MTTTLEQWQAGKAVEGLPPWDGTGIPLPVDATGWPVVPGGGTGEPTTLVLSGEPPAGDLPAGTGTVLTVTASAPLPSNTVKVELSVDDGTTWLTLGQPGGPPDTLVFTLSATPGGAAGTTASYRASDPADAAVVSNVLVYTIVAASADPNMGWTKAELIQFAADHEPPIDVPASGTKAEILAAILAYIQDHPEEN